MRIPIFIQRLYNKATRAKFFYVTLDVCPDFSTGQGEMCSYTIRSKNGVDATRTAIRKAMKEWSVDMDAVYVVDCMETQSHDLIYDIDR